MVVRGKRGFTPRTFFRASSVPSEMSPKDTWTSEQLHASNHFVHLIVGKRKYT